MRMSHMQKATTAFLVFSVLMATEYPALRGLATASRFATISTGRAVAPETPVLIVAVLVRIRFSNARQTRPRGSRLLLAG